MLCLINKHMKTGKLYLINQYRTYLNIFLLLKMNWIVILLYPANPIVKIFFIYI